MAKTFDTHNHGTDLTPNKEQNPTSKMIAIETFHDLLKQTHKLLVQSGVVSIEELKPNQESFTLLGISLEKVSEQTVTPEAWQALQFLRKQNKNAIRHPEEVRRAVNPNALDNLAVMKLPESWHLETAPDSHNTRYYIKDNPAAQIGYFHKSPFISFLFLFLIFAFCNTL